MYEKYKMYLLVSIQGYASKIYPTDLTDKQWNVLEPLIPTSKVGGRPRTVCAKFSTLSSISLPVAVRGA